MIDTSRVIKFIIWFNVVIVAICFIIYMLASDNMTEDEVTIHLKIYVTFQIICTIVSIITGIWKWWNSDRIIGMGIYDLQILVIILIIPNIARIMIQLFKYKEIYIKILPDLVFSDERGIKTLILLAIYTIMYIMGNIFEWVDGYILAKRRYNSF